MKNKKYRAGQTIYDSAGQLGLYKDTSAICRAAILNCRGTNEDNFHTTFTIVKPLWSYKERCRCNTRCRTEGAGQIVFDNWDVSDDCEGQCPCQYAQTRQGYVKDTCCKGIWPPAWGLEINRYLKYSNAFKNEW
jgi:hypothetical protein